MTEHEVPLYVAPSIDKREAVEGLDELIDGL
jgi:hypothetical protein